MKTLPVYNLEFPSHCSEIEIFGYRFKRTDDYKERVLGLQHLVDISSEYHKKSNTGGHEITATVEIPDVEEQAILKWADDSNPALEDILLLLSIFTRREVFTQTNPGVIIADPRMYQWGGILRTSIPYRGESIEPDPYTYDIGFIEGLNQIYELIRSDEWQDKYNQGYFLFLARMAFRRQTLDSSFIQCWTIWEHLFAILNKKWMDENKIRQMQSVEKISFLLVQYALVGEINKTSRGRIETLANIRNRLIHFGMFPDREGYTKEDVYNDADLFIRLTEFVIAKILGLVPSNVFNTMERLEDFIDKANS